MSASFLNSFIFFLNFYWNLPKVKLFLKTPSELRERSVYTTVSNTNFVPNFDFQRHRSLLFAKGAGYSCRFEACFTPGPNSCKYPFYRVYMYFNKKTESK